MDGYMKVLPYCHTFQLLQEKFLSFFYMTLLHISGINDYLSTPGFIVCVEDFKDFTEQQQEPHSLSNIQSRL